MNAPARVNFALTSRPDPDLQRAHEQLARIQIDSRQAIKVMTAEAALLAQKVVREAGRRGR